MIADRPSRRRILAAALAAGAAPAGAAAAAAGPVGRWLAEDIMGGGVLDRAQTVLEIGADGRVSGSGGCNRIVGTARLDGAGIAFGPIGSTRMACTPAVMNQEAKFLAALEKVRRWRVDAPRRKLILSDGQGADVLVLARMGPGE